MEDMGSNYIVKCFILQATGENGEFEEYNSSSKEQLFLFDSALTFVKQREHFLTYSTRSALSETKNNDVKLNTHTHTQTTDQYSVGTQM